MGIKRTGSILEKAKTEHEIGLEIRHYGRDSDDDAYSALCIKCVTCNFSVMS